jgi:hypothetical protein
VKIGDRWVSYQRIEPLATILGLAADAVEAEDLDTGRELARKGMSAIAQNLTNKTFLQGVENFFQFLGDPERYGESAFKSYLGSVVPAAAGAAARAIDPTLRETHLESPEDILNVMAARVPGLSQNLPPRYTTTGEPAQRPEAGFGEGLDALIRFASPVQVSQPQPEGELQRELYKAGIGKTPPRRKDKFTTVSSTQEGYTMTPDEQAEMAAADKLAAAALLPLVRSKIWGALSDENQKKYVDDTYEYYRRRARRQIESRRAMLAVAR